jgi:adenosylcobinamide-phosphate synthase
MTSAAITLLLAICLDRVAGEPKFAHPLIGFGNLANLVERYLHNSYDENESANKSSTVLNFKGTLAITLLIVPFVALCAFMQKIPSCSIIFNVLILYLCIGARSLEDHAQAVASALCDGDINVARAQVSKIVSRDTSDMNETGIARATVESVLENGNDAIFATIFWFVLLGAPGAVLYRLANTLDAMWGYKNSKYLHFGWAAARFDDCLNLIPARLTALTYSLLGNCKVAWHCWRSQGYLWYSPNAGPVMAAGAGALCLKLGGPASYGGKLKERPTLGQGPSPTAEDINRAIKLVRNGLWLWTALIFGWGALH